MLVILTMTTESLVLAKLFKVVKFSNRHRLLHQKKKKAVFHICVITEAYDGYELE